MIQFLIFLKCLYKWFPIIYLSLQKKAVTVLTNACVICMEELVRCTSQTCSCKYITCKAIGIASYMYKITIPNIICKVVLSVNCIRLRHYSACQ